MFCLPRALLASLIAWICCGTVMLGLSGLMESDRFGVLDAFMSSGDSGVEMYMHALRGFFLGSLAIVSGSCLLVIAPLMAQFPPGSLLWRRRWIGPLAALAAMNVSWFALDTEGSHLTVTIPIVLSSTVATAAFTFVYVTQMRYRAKKLATPQPYVD